ncbi:hypothetical protein IE4771_PB00031 (plasmid) [Rhizobium etli bv. mimosae str. IE4771]|uniref:Uncharacterized protein n=1 Tax=Rhizobium etli bv. mimosae str. IE4771 TaxID=1432050 RepID=A0A060IDH5_RHIET|nr:hypothetical protein [Rhizobium sp. IE4771]AIC29766.1 hypothetical protein IE4771_PB00031 [Rhizobium sp. IE4771]
MQNTVDHPAAGETLRSLTRTQEEALRAVAFFWRKRKVGRGWLLGDKGLSKKLVERLEKMELVEESFIRGEPVLQLTIVGQAIKAQLLQKAIGAASLPDKRQILHFSPAAEIG